MGLPATKITGKWLFPRHLVEKWLERQTIKYPESADGARPDERILIIAGSNDLLLERTISPSSGACILTIWLPSPTWAAWAV